MNEDDFERELGKRLDDEGMERFKLMWKQWKEMTGSLPSPGTEGVEWMDEVLLELGLDLRALMLFAIKLAVVRNEPPMDFSSTFCSGFMSGWLGALVHKGDDPFAVLREEKEKHPDEESGPQKLDTDTELLMNVKNMHSIGEFLRSQARTIGKEFTDPDDDWSPIMLVVTTKQAGLIGMDIPHDEEMKDLLFTELLPRTIKETMNGKPKAVGLVVSAWKLEGDEHREWFENRDEDERIADHPDRQETLFCYLADRERHEMWSAPIYRDDEQAPALGEWKQEPSGDEQTGKIVEMMQRILG